MLVRFGSMGIRPSKRKPQDGGLGNMDRRRGLEQTPRHRIRAIRYFGKPHRQYLGISSRSSAVGNLAVVDRVASCCSRGRSSHLGCIDEVLRADIESPMKLAQARIQAIRQGEVDDSERSSE
jgi:hypothetical protein